MKTRSFVLSLPETLLQKEDVIASLAVFGGELHPIIKFDTVLNNSVVIYFHRPTQAFYFEVNGLFSEAKSLKYTKKWVHKFRKYVSKYEARTLDLGIRPWCRWIIFWRRNLHKTSPEDISIFFTLCILGLVFLFSFSAIALFFISLKSFLIGWALVLVFFYWWLFIE